MKARIINTGEEITILGISSQWGSAQYIDSNRVLRVRTFCDKEIEIISTDNEESINWEQRRYEIAKEAMGAFIASPSYQFFVNNNYYEAQHTAPNFVAKDAVEYADALINELKKRTK